jgi:hypothetical protein
LSGKGHVSPSWVGAAASDPQDKENNVSELVIRIYYQSSRGSIEDSETDFGLEDFGGLLPAVGDRILDPSTESERERSDPSARTMWVVIGRVFNPRDLPGSVALVVETRRPEDDERVFLP